MKDHDSGERGVFTVRELQTGKDWCNFLWNEGGFQTEVTHTGASTGLFVSGNSDRIVLNQKKSNVIYLRDRETKEYWNVGGYPSAAEVENFTCRHGMNFSEISSERGGISASVRITVSQKLPHEIRRVTVRNNGKTRRFIDLFVCTVFDMEGYPQPFYYNAFTTSETLFLKEANAIVCRSANPYAHFARKNAFLLSDRAPSAFEGFADRFTGLTGGFCRPLTLERGEDLSCSLATVRSRCGILEHALVLEAGEEQTVFYLLGFCGEELASEREEMLREARTVDAQAEQSGNFGRLRTTCPDERMELLMNFWAEKQVRYCCIGKKAVRDNSQLAMGLLDFDTDGALKVLGECLEHQYKDGHAVLLWYPVVDDTLYSDPAFWLILACCEYVKETGDLSFLEREYAWLDGGRATVLSHLRAAALWYLKKENLGPHALPKIFRADWNDALNIPDEEAESVFMGECVCLALRELSHLLARLNEGEQARFLSEKRAELAAALNRYAWNGDYYVRALTRLGSIGDKDSDGGKFYINAQSFALLAGIVPAERKATLFHSIDGAVTDEGVRLCTPPYTHYDERVGRMSGMLPGVYENGGIYNHAGCFKVMADCLEGRSEEAYRSLSAIIPNGKFNPSSRSTVEPYVFVNCYFKHPSVDMMCSDSWQTGTSAWGLRCYYEGLLGIGRTLDGLKISPAFPKAWQGATAQRFYRGALLHFTFENQGGTRPKLIIDGKKREGTLIPPFDDRGEHNIEVLLTH